MPWDTGDEARGCFSQVWREGTKEFHRQKEQCVTSQAMRTAARQREKGSPVRRGRWPRPEVLKRDGTKWSPEGASWLNIPT